jgi:hypothetical protein
MNSPSTTIAKIIDQIGAKLSSASTPEQYKTTALKLLQAQSVIPVDQIGYYYNVLQKRYPFDKYKQNQQGSPEMKENSLADTMLALAREINPNARLNNPDQRRRETADMIANRVPKTNPPPSAADVDSAQQRLAQLQKKFDPDYQYSDDFTYWSEQDRIRKEIQSLKRVTSTQSARPTEECIEHPKYGKLKIESTGSKCMISKNNRVVYSSTKDDVMEKWSAIKQSMASETVVENDSDDDQDFENKPTRKVPERPQAPDFSWVSNFDITEIKKEIDNIVEYLGSTESDEEVRVLRNDIRVLDNLASALKRGDGEKIVNYWKIACSEGSCEHLHDEFVEKMNSTTAGGTTQYESLAAFIKRDETPIVFESTESWTTRCTDLNLTTKKEPPFIAAYTAEGELVGSYNPSAKRGWVYVEEGYYDDDRADYDYGQSLQNDMDKAADLDDRLTSPAARAILNRIIRSHPTYLDDPHLEDAINDVASFYVDFEELGSSDISGMVKRVLDQLNSRKGDPVHEDQFSPPSSRDMQKLASRIDKERWARSAAYEILDRLKYDADQVSTNELRSVHQKYKPLAQRGDKVASEVARLSAQELHNRSEVVQELSKEKLSSYARRAEQEARKNRMDPTKRSPEKQSRTVGMYARAYDKMNANLGESGAEKKQANITKLKKDLADAEHWARNARHGREQREYERKAQNIRNHLKNQYGITEGIRASVRESSPPGEEQWVKSNKNAFIKQYGEEKGLEVLYATAWSRYNKKHSQVQENTEKEINWSTLEVDGVHKWDYPDFSDAYFSYGEYTDGTPIDDAMLDRLTDERNDLVNDLAHKRFF